MPLSQAAHDPALLLLSRTKLGRRPPCGRKVATPARDAGSIQRATRNRPSKGSGRAPLSRVPLGTCGPHTSSSRLLSLARTTTGYATDDAMPWFSLAGLGTVNAARAHTTVLAPPSARPESVAALCTFCNLGNNENKATQLGLYDVTCGLPREVV